MENKLGIQELTQLVVYISKLGTLSWNALEDHTIDFRDVDEIWSILKLSQGLTKLDYNKVVCEWADLDDDERATLVAEFKKNFNPPDVDIEQMVEAVVELAIELYGLIINIKKIFKK